MDDSDLHSLNRCLSTLKYLFINIDRITPEKEYEEKSGGYGDVQVSTLDKGTPSAKLVVTKTLRLSAVKKRPHRLALRFARELRVWAGLNHPHILSLLGYHLDQNRRKAILVSDYMSYGDLKEYIDDQNPVWSVRLELARDITDGLSYLHTRTPPICHGDLKMGNILVSSNLRAVVADFGLSTMLEEEGTGLTTSIGLKGTARYYSPELILESDAKHSLQSDIWAWGCLIIETLTDTIPYPQKRIDHAVLLALSSKELPVNLESLSIPSPDHELKALLGKCWSFAPADRPSAPTCLEIMSKLSLSGASADGETRGQVGEIQLETLPPGLSAEAQQEAFQSGLSSILTASAPTFNGTQWIWCDNCGRRWFAGSGNACDCEDQDETRSSGSLAATIGSRHDVSPLTGLSLDPTTPAVLAHLQASEAISVPGSAEARQKALQSRLGLINTGPDPSAPTNPPPAPQLQQNTDLWNGSLMFVTPDGKGGAQEITASVLAKRGGPTNVPHPQFVVWPSTLRFSPLHLRPFRLQELAGIIKQNGIPLCTIEPNPAPFGENLEAKAKNEQIFARLHQVLSVNNAGAAIAFDVPAGPQGTGVFVFSPPPRDGVRLVGAVFLTQPIPQLSPPEAQGVAANPVQSMALQQVGGLGIGPRPGGIQNPNATLPGPMMGSVRNLPRGIRHVFDR